MECLVYHGKEHVLWSVADGASNRKTHGWGNTGIHWYQTSICGCEVYRVMVKEMWDIDVTP